MIERRSPNPEADNQIDEMRKCLQAHSDSFEGDRETVVDFLVVVATINDEGTFCYSYVISSMLSPHSAVGLANMGVSMVEEDMLPVR